MQNKPWLLVSLVLAAIVYGSLYPFAFHVPPGDGGALRSFLETWRRPPQSRGDLLANIIFYMPLGFVLVRRFADRFEKKTALLLTIAAGASLSASMEILQHFDAGRVSAMSDFYLNTVGTGAGALAGLVWGHELLTIRFVPKGASLFAALLLLAWFGWRLFPYEPVIDLHKYWSSAKPIVLTPSVDAYDTFQYATMWGAVVYLAQFGLKVREPLLTIALGMAAVFFAKMLIIDQLITLPEIVGALVALFYLVFILRPYRTAGTRALAVLFLISIALERVLPFQVSTTARPFEWIPFFSFLHGSPAVNAQSFMQKVFLYGAGLSLLTDSGLSLVWASVLEGSVLLSTSLVETILVSRSAEITDAVMVILVAIVWHFLDNRGQTLRKQLPQS